MKELNPRIFIKRTNSHRVYLKDLFGKFDISGDVKWDAKDEDAYVSSACEAFRAAENRDEAEAVMEEIHTLAQKEDIIEAVHNTILQLSLGEEAREECRKLENAQDILLCLYSRMKSREDWNYLMRMCEGDLRNPKMQYCVKLTKSLLPETNPASRLPDFTEKLNEHRQKYKGRGQYVEVIPVRNESETRYYVYTDDVCRYHTTCSRDGNFLHDTSNRDTEEMLFIYSPAEWKLYVISHGYSKKQKRILASIFASTMLNMEVEQDDPHGTVFNLDVFRDADFILAPGDMDAIDDVRVSEIGVRCSEVENETVILRHASGGILDKLRTEPEKYEIFNSGIIVYVILKFTFAPDAGGRKERIPVKITASHMGQIKKKKLREVVEEALKYWGIDER